MWLFVLPLLVVIADQFSKYIVVENMALGESIPVIEGIFHLTYILNPGAAFGMFAHSRLFLSALPWRLSGSSSGRARRFWHRLGRLNAARVCFWAAR